jgi:hypothetical protein
MTNKVADLELIRTTARTADLPPMPKQKLGPRKKRNAKDRPMTQVERDAVRWKAIKDIGWGLKHRGWVSVGFAQPLLLSLRSYSPARGTHSP